MLKVYCTISKRERLWLWFIPMGWANRTDRRMLTREEARRLVAEGWTVRPLACRTIMDRGIKADAAPHTRVLFDDSLPMILSDWP